jgi:hypothetical protein
LLLLTDSLSALTENSYFEEKVVIFDDKLAAIRKKFALLRKKLFPAREI